MPQTAQHPLVGAWEKATVSSCSEVYPDHIVFQPDGLYFGHRDPPGTFTAWDVGRFEIVDPAHVRISTANDAIITYGLVIKDGIATFVDPEECEFAYRRVQP